MYMLGALGIMLVSRRSMLESHHDQDNFLSVVVIL